MEERKCKDCVFNSFAHHGCCTWDCEYINRGEAVKAYKELHKEDKNKCENTTTKTVCKA